MLWNLDYRRLDILEKELEQLDPTHRLAFAASICERLLPIYNAFAKDINVTSHNFLIDAIEEIWQILKGKTLDEDIILQLIEDCEGLMPDEDDMGLYDCEASMTVTAICDTLEACIEPTAQQIVKVVELVGDILFGFTIVERETIDPDWRQGKSFDELVQYLASHPLGVREATKQTEDLQRLKEVDTLDREFIEQLRTSNDGKSVLYLS